MNQEADNYQLEMPINLHKYRVMGSELRKTESFLHYFLTRKIRSNDIYFVTFAKSYPNIFLKLLLISVLRPTVCLNLLQIKTHVCGCRCFTKELLGSNRAFADNGQARQSDVKYQLDIEISYHRLK